MYHQMAYKEGTSASSDGEVSGWWSHRSWVRTTIPTRGFSLFSLLQVMQLPHARCATMVRVMCPSPSKPRDDFRYLSAM